MIGRLWATIRRDRGEREMRAETESLINLHADELERSGLTAAEALRQARLRFGAKAQFEEAYRSQARFAYIEQIIGDIRYGARRLAQRPLYFFAAVATLAAGIGIHATVFSLVHALLLKPLPIAQPDRVFTLERQKGSNLSFPLYLEIAQRTDLFASVAAMRAMPAAISNGGAAERYWGFLVTGKYFELTGIKPSLGRLLTPADDVSNGGHPVVVISHGAWQRRFGGDPAIVGKVVKVNGAAFSIIGVAPEGFTGTEAFFAAEYWVPFSMIQTIENRDWRTGRRTHNAWAIARLRDGVSEAQASAALRVLAAQIAKEHPASDEGLTLGLMPPGLINRNVRTALGNGSMALMVVSLLTLLVACANLAGLILAQTSDRAREFALRFSLGAGRGAVTRMLVAETMIIALGGGIAGFLTSVWAGGLIAAIIPQDQIPFRLNLAPEWSVAAYAGGLSLLTALLCGLWPALRVSRLDAYAVLKDSASIHRSRRFASRDVFVAGQVALTVVLLAGAAMMARGLQSAATAHHGITPDGAAILRFDLGMRGYKKDQGLVLQQRILNEVRALPGIEAAAMANSMPFSIDQSSNTIYAEGAPDVALSQVQRSVPYAGTSDLFRALGTRLLEGREFNDADRTGAKRVAIVNQTLVIRMFGPGSGVGRRVRFCPECQWMEIVGVVEPGRYQTVAETPQMAIWTPLAQDYNGMTTVIVRTRGREADLIGPIRAIIANADPELAVLEAMPYRKYLDLPLTPGRVLFSTLTAMAVIAALLSGLGLYAVVAYALSRRTRELGIRAALGASSLGLARLTVHRAAILIGASAAIGLIAAVVLLRQLGRLVSVEAEPSAFAIACLAIVVVATCALISPAARAMRIRPMEALRHD